MKKIIAQNKKAYHDYFVEETIEAGVCLLGQEVKSIRQGKVQLKGSWCDIVDMECILKGVHISPILEVNSFFNTVEPYRDRKLLLHKHEIKKLFSKIQQNGYTLVPLELYFIENKVKCLLGVCKGKKNYDKRESIKKRDIEREIQRKIR